MEQVCEILRNVQVVAFTLLGIAAVGHWWRHRGEAAGWLAATFGILAAVVVAGRVLPPDRDAPALLWAGKALIAVLVLFPYCLWRFKVSIAGLVRWRWVLAHALTGLLFVWALALPDIPERGQPRSTLFEAFIIALLVQWVLLSAFVISGLWQAGEGQPTVARRRMRTLSLGAAGLAFALLVAGAASPHRGVSASDIVTQVLALVSAPLFLLGFAPPPAIRSMWRQHEEARLREAEAALMAATDPRSVADVLLSPVTALVGGRAAVLVDDRGDILGSYGLDREEALEVARGAPPRRSEEEAPVLRFPLQRGALFVISSPYTPYFGREEMGLLRGLASLADLALARAALFQELARSNQDLENFAYVASHDLQEPLRAVSSYVQLLERRYRDHLDDDAREFIGYAVEGVHRMQRLINDLLDFARLDQQGDPTVVTDAGAAVREAISNLGLLVDEAGASIDVGDLPSVRADRVQLTQLFQNLIGNALKFRSQAPPEVSIDAERLNGTWRFRVADNGIGIDPRYADRVFTIFKRLHGREAYGGTGIGLSICKRIVERHGGHIWVESEEGRGATFLFTLPAVAQV